MINKTTRDLIAAQCIDEISFARNARRPRLAKWWANEDLYYSNKKITSDERTNVNLNEAQGFVQTFLAKINVPFNFKFVKGEEADLKAAQVTNAIKDKDHKIGKWNFKALVARVQLIIYGRYVFEYHADSVDGYKSHLSNVDVYQFLIDPSCGGLDIEKAFYMGRGNILKDKKNIKDGINLLMKNPLVKGQYEIDSYWQKLQAFDRWYILSPRTVTQRPNFSTIENRYTDYNYLMLD